LSSKVGDFLEETNFENFCGSVKRVVLIEARKDMFSKTKFEKIRLFGVRAGL
jgi:hypothetical protein